MNNIIYLLLVAVGFYFGKYLGAITLPLCYHVLRLRVKKTRISASDYDWAYKMLNLTPHADIETVKQVRKQLINQHHPDKLPPQASDAEKQAAAKKINDINRAFAAIQQAKQHESSEKNQ